MDPTALILVLTDTHMDSDCQEYKVDQETLPSRHFADLASQPRGLHRKGTGMSLFSLLVPTLLRWISRHSVLHFPPRSIYVPHDGHESSGGGVILHENVPDRRQ